MGLLTGPKPRMCLNALVAENATDNVTMEKFNAHVAGKPTIKSKVAFDQIKIVYVMTADWAYTFISYITIYLTWSCDSSSGNFWLTFSNVRHLS